MVAERSSLGRLVKTAKSLQQNRQRSLFVVPFATENRALMSSTLMLFDKLKKIKINMRFQLSKNAYKKRQYLISINTTGMFFTS